MTRGKTAHCDILHYDNVEIHAKMYKIWYNACSHLTPFQLVVSVYLPVSFTWCNNNQPVPTTSFLKKVAVKQLHVNLNTNSILDGFHHGFRALKLLHSNILRMLTSNNVTVLFLLDLSAEFGKLDDSLVVDCFGKLLVSPAQCFSSFIIFYLEEFLRQNCVTDI